MQDITPKWEDVALKNKIISNEDDFGNRIGGLGSPSVSSVIKTQEDVKNLNGSMNITGWSSSIVFHSVDYDSVSWDAGDIYLKDGTTFNIISGNTGNMTATTYIFFDKNISTTELQITTNPAQSVGIDRILVAVAQNNSVVTSQASYQVFGGAGGFMVTKEGIAAGTITGDRIAANTINVNQIVAGTFTGFTFRTASSGTRVEITASGNDLSVYDGSNRVIGLGSYQHAALDINLTSSSTVNASNGVYINSTVNGVGYYYNNSSNVSNVAMILNQTGTTNNTSEALRINYGGSYYAQYMHSTGTGGGLIIDTDGIGKSLYILSNSTAIAAEIISDGYNATALSIQNTGGGSGIGLKINNSGSNGGLVIQNYGGLGLLVENYSNFYTATRIVDNSSVYSMFIEKTVDANPGSVLNLVGNINKNGDLVGINLDLFHGGVGNVYAFQFYGPSIVNSSVGGSQDKKIKVSVGGVTYYIPLYTA